MSKPTVAAMIHEAVLDLGGRAANTQIRDWIVRKYPGTNHNTISAQIIVASVNHPSRIHYSENRKPRSCNTQYDFLFRPRRGEVELYNSEKHGGWCIREREDGSLTVVRTDEVMEPIRRAVGHTGDQNEFAAEAHLRDYLAKNLGLIESGLELYVSDEGESGVEYSTDVGFVDLLAVDSSKNLVVIELKVARSSDAVVGQLLRYRSWIKKHLADGRMVRGMIIAQRIPEQIKYAVTDLNDVELVEYQLSLALQKVA